MIWNFRSLGSNPLFFNETKKSNNDAFRREKNSLKSLPPPSSFRARAFRLCVIKEEGCDKVEKFPCCNLPAFSFYDLFFLLFDILQSTSLQTEFDSLKFQTKGEWCHFIDMLRNCFPRVSFRDVGRRAGAARKLFSWQSIWDERANVFLFRFALDIKSAIKYEELKLKRFDGEMCLCSRSSALRLPTFFPQLPHKNHPQ